VVDEVNRVEVDGLVLAYRRTGQGPPLVLLHGAYEDSRIWRRQLEELSDEFSVVAWDAPGCGGSDDPPEGFTAADYDHCVAGFLRALELGPAHVLGLSWGSMLALGLYKHHPEGVATLVLASAYAGWAGSLPPDEVERRIAQVLREVDLPPEDFVADWVPTLLTPSAPQELVDEVVASMGDVHPVGMRAAVQAMGWLDHRDVLPTITVPTLLLYGDVDVRSPVQVGRDLQAALPSSSLVVLPGAPHLAHVEAPDAFNRAVRTFLHGHRDAVRTSPGRSPHVEQSP
jgi:pimeloyl-ACP methyl ester carboxylesterase